MRQAVKRSFVVVSAMTLVAALLAHAASAQGADAATVRPSAGVRAQTFADSWQFQLGAGVVSRPEYPGSDDNEVEIVPVIGATYGRYFLGGVPGSGSPVGLGAYLYQGSNLRVGVALGGRFSKPREESDDARLRGLGDVDATVRGGLFASYSYSWVTVRGSLSTDVGGKDQGTLATLDIEGRYRPSEHLTISAGPGLTWADREYTQTFFGIDAVQSARSGRPRYRADSGLDSVRFSVGADYRLTPHWNLGARVIAARLRGNAADSPITFDKSQNTVGAFASYRF